MRQDLSEKLEVWGFEEGFLIYKDLSLGTILKLSPRDVSVATDETLNTLHSAICGFLNGLPEGLNLQFVQDISAGAESVLEEHLKLSHEKTSDFAKKLSEERVKSLRSLNLEGKIPSQNLYLVIRRKFQNQQALHSRKKKRSLFWFWRKLPEEQFDWPRDILIPETNAFSQVVENTTLALSNLGMNAKQMTEDETFHFLFNQWNPDHPIPGVNYNKEDIRDELLLSDLVISIRGFCLGATHHRLLSLKIMPELTYAAMIEKLKFLPFNSRLYLTIETLDQNKEDLMLGTQRRVAYAMSVGKQGVSDLESDAKLKDIESLLEKRVSGEEKIFSASLNILLRGTSESELEELCQKVLSLIRDLGGAEGMKETLAASSIFLELSLPNARCQERTRRVNTSVLADFLPLFGDWSGHLTPRVLLRNRAGSLVKFDLFSSTLTNANQIVSGGSGAGKSFASNIMIAHLMKENPKVFILDIGGSYKKLSQNLGGQYVPVGANSSLSLNPFDLTDQSSEAVDQKIKFMTSLVELMTKEDEASGIGKLERSEIEQMIKEILKSEAEPRLTHLKNKLLAHPEKLLVRMGKILASWCGDSPYGKFVDQKTSFTLTSDIVCFDLKGLETMPDLQAVCLFIMTDLIWREVQKDQTSMKLVVFDECWSLLENEAGSRFLGEVFRTFRKYRASAIAISQTMDDFANSHVASAILPNASVKWILKQTGGNMPSLQKILRLNERETKLIESVTSKKGAFSEAFLIAGDDKQVVRIESTPLEYWLATTDPADIKAFNQKKELFPDLKDVQVLEILAKEFPKGASV